MKSPIVATCSNTGGCANHDNLTRVICCAFEGSCGGCRLHSNCATDAGGLVSPQVAGCGNGDCPNAALTVLVCQACGWCGDCRLHDH